jgi:hypothetical protein
MTTRSLYVLALLSAFLALPVLGQTGGGTTFPGGGGSDVYAPTDPSDYDMVPTTKNQALDYLADKVKNQIGTGELYVPTQPTNWQEPLPGFDDEGLDDLADQKSAIIDMGSLMEGDGSPVDLYDCVGPTCLFMREDEPELWFSTVEGTAGWNLGGGTGPFSGLGWQDSDDSGRCYRRPRRDQAQHRG